MAKSLKLKNSDFFSPEKYVVDNLDFHTAETKREMTINV